MSTTGAHLFRASWDRYDLSLDVADSRRTIGVTYGDHLECLGMSLNSS